jgi:Zn-dependent protease
MLGLLNLPIELLRIGFYVLKGIVDALSARDRLRFESTVLINAAREAVWRFNAADRVVLDGPPLMETSSEPLPDSADLLLTRVAIGGQPRSQGVSREIERDETRGVIRAQWLDHPLSVPPDGGRNIISGIKVETTPEGTAYTMFIELTVRSFRDRIVYPVGLRQIAKRVKQQCEQEAGINSRLSDIANHGLLLSAVALLSFGYLLGWKSGLLFTIVIVLHEAGHAAAMLLAGVGVRGIYLVPFFGGAAVPKTTYRTEGRLGFVALMGSAPSLIPTLALLAMYRAAGGAQLREAVEMFAVINAANLLPIYPLDGGLILNALIGSVSRKSALIVTWIGLLTGLGLALYWQSLLIGIPFLLFALQRYLSGGRTIELERISFGGGVALALASIVTFVLYAFTIITL